MPQVRILSSGPHKENCPLWAVLFVFSCYGVEYAASCEQSKALALGNEATAAGGGVKGAERVAAASSPSAASGRFSEGAECAVVGR